VTRPSVERRAAFARCGYIGLIVLVMATFALDGLRSGWANWLPGSMSRHRDAVAVAITAVA
jgi:hypothetical protein